MKTKEEGRKNRVSQTDDNEIVLVSSLAPTNSLPLCCGRRGTPTRRTTDASGSASSLFRSLARARRGVGSILDGSPSRPRLPHARLPVFGSGSGVKPSRRTVAARSRCLLLRPLFARPFPPPQGSIGARLSRDFYYGRRTAPWVAARLRLFGVNRIWALQKRP